MDQVLVDSRNPSNVLDIESIVKWNLLRGLMSAATEFIAPIKRYSKKESFRSYYSQELSAKNIRQCRIGQARKMCERRESAVRQSVPKMWNTRIEISSCSTTGYVQMAVFVEKT